MISYIHPRFTKGMIDSLNAEISLGTVANTHEAVQWMGFTYLFVRMLKNPFQYGKIFCLFCFVLLLTVP